MFCQKCGTQLSDDVRFCPSCGASTSGVGGDIKGTYNRTVQAVQAADASNGIVHMIVGIVINALLLLALFLPWVKFNDKVSYYLSMIDIDSSANVWKLCNFVRDLFYWASYATNDDVPFIITLGIILVRIIFIAAILAVIVSIVSIATKKLSKSLTSIVCFLNVGFVVFLFLLVLIIKIATNSFIDSNSYYFGFYGNVKLIKLGVFAWFAVILAIVNLVLTVTGFYQQKGVKNAGRRPQNMHYQPGQAPRGPYQNQAGQAPRGPYQGQAGQAPRGPYQNQPGQVPPRPYQGQPGQTGQVPPRPYQNQPVMEQPDSYAGQPQTDHLNQPQAPASGEAANPGVQAGENGVQANPESLNQEL